MVTGTYIKIYQTNKGYFFEVACFLNGDYREGKGTAPTAVQAFDKCQELLAGWEAESGK